MGVGAPNATPQQTLISRSPTDLRALPISDSEPGGPECYIPAPENHLPLRARATGELDYAK